MVEKIKKKYCWLCQKKMIKLKEKDTGEKYWFCEDCHTLIRKGKEE